MRGKFSERFDFSNMPQKLPKSPRVRNKWRLHVGNRPRISCILRRECGQWRSQRMPRDRRGVQPTFVIQQSPPTFRLYQRRRLLIRRRRTPTTYLLHVLFLILRKVRGHQNSDFLEGKWYPFMCNDVCLPDVPM